MLNLLDKKTIVCKITYMETHDNNNYINISLLLLFKVTDKLQMTFRHSCGPLLHHALYNFILTVDMS